MALAQKCSFDDVAGSEHVACPGQLALRARPQPQQLQT